VFTRFRRQGAGVAVASRHPKSPQRQHLRRHVSPRTRLSRDELVLVKAPPKSSTTLIGASICRDQPQPSDSGAAPARASMQTMRRALRPRAGGSSLAHAATQLPVVRDRSQPLGCNWWAFLKTTEFSRSPGRSLGQPAPTTDGEQSLRGRRLSTRHGPAANLRARHGSAACYPQYRSRVGSIGLRSVQPIASKRRASRVAEGRGRPLHPTF